jgi:hypothetical protein
VEVTDDKAFWWWKGGAAVGKALRPFLYEEEWLKSAAHQPKGKGLDWSGDSPREAQQQ